MNQEVQLTGKAALGNFMARRFGVVMCRPLGSCWWSMAWVIMAVATNRWQSRWWRGGGVFTPLIYPGTGVLREAAVGLILFRVCSVILRQHARRWLIDSWVATGVARLQHGRQSRAQLPLEMPGRWKSLSIKPDGLVLCAPMFCSRLHPHPALTYLRLG